MTWLWPLEETLRSLDRRHQSRRAVAFVTTRSHVRSMITPVFKWQWQMAWAPPSTVVTAQRSETKNTPVNCGSLRQNINSLFSLQVHVSFVPLVWGDTVSICFLLISFLSCDALAQVGKPWEAFLINLKTFSLLVSAEQTLRLKAGQKRKEKRNPCWLTMSWRWMKAAAEIQFGRQTRPPTS